MKSWRVHCTPKNEGKRVHVPPDGKNCGHAGIVESGIKHHKPTLGLFLLTCGLLAPKDFKNYLACQTFVYGSTWMKVIPETHRPHSTLDIYLFILTLQCLDDFFFARFIVSIVFQEFKVYLTLECLLLAERQIKHILIQGFKHTLSRLDVGKGIVKFTWKTLDNLFMHNINWFWFADLLPSFEVQPTNSTVKMGDGFRLDCTVLSKYPVIYDWYKNHDIIKRSDQSFYEVNVLVYCIKLSNQITVFVLPGMAWVY